MDELIDKIITFRDERNWLLFHNPKDLAISLSLEAGELLENFQWRTNEQAIAENRENIRDEMADVAIYLILLADILDIDMKEAIQAKMEKNGKKYPVVKSYGSFKKYTEL